MTSFDEVLTRLAAIEQTQSPGLGWALAHCAQSIEYAVRGFPTQKPEWFQKTIGRVVLARFLSKGSMSHDVTAAIPGAQDVERSTPVAEGAKRLREAISLFRAHSGSYAPHVVYGAVDRASYEAVQSMHVADHLSR